MYQLMNKKFCQKRVDFLSEGTRFQSDATSYDSNGQVVGKVTIGIISEFEIANWNGIYLQGCSSSRIKSAANARIKEQV